MKRKHVLSFWFLLWMGLLFGLPYLIYGKCKDVYDFHTCESYAQGRTGGASEQLFFLGYFLTFKVLHIARDTGAVAGAQAIIGLGIQEFAAEILAIAAPHP